MAEENISEECGCAPVDIHFDKEALEHLRERVLNDLRRIVKEPCSMEIIESPTEQGKIPHNTDSVDELAYLAGRAIINDILLRSMREQIKRDGERPLPAL